jgi:multisubunit Na+/H+ antiporter MnhC subunit
MSNRRNFLALMAGTATLGVLSSNTIGVFQPTLAQERCTVSLSVLERIASEGLAVLQSLADALKALVGKIETATPGGIVGEMGKIEALTEAASRFWSDPAKVAGFVRGSSQPAMQAIVKTAVGSVPKNKVEESLKRVLAELKRATDPRNIKIEEFLRDPILGPIIQVGNNAAQVQFRKAATIHKQIVQLRSKLTLKIETKIGKELVNLKRERKIKNEDLQILRRRYPSLTPAIERVLSISRTSGSELSNSGLEGQVKSGTPIDTFDAVLDVSASSKSKFDVYAEAFDSHLFAVTNEGGGQTFVDSLLGIEKANAFPPLLVALIIVAIVVAVATVAVVGTVAVAETIKNEVCRELTLKETQAEMVTACEVRAGERRIQRLNTENSSFTQCKADFRPDIGVAGTLLCTLGYAYAKSNIESDYEKDVDACS